MSDNDKANIIQVLDDIIAENEVMAIQVFVETSQGRGFAVECSPSDIHAELPLRKVMH